MFSGASVSQAEPLLKLFIERSLDQFKERVISNLILKGKFK